MPGAESLTLAYDQRVESWQADRQSYGNKPLYYASSNCACYNIVPVVVITKVWPNLSPDCTSGPADATFLPFVDLDTEYCNIDCIHIRKASIKADKFFIWQETCHDRYSKHVHNQILHLACPQMPPLMCNRFCKCTASKSNIYTDSASAERRWKSSGSSTSPDAATGGDADFTSGLMQTL